MISPLWLNPNTFLKPRCHILHSFLYLSASFFLPSFNYIYSSITKSAFDIYYYIVHYSLIVLCMVC